MRRRALGLSGPALLLLAAVPAAARADQPRPFKGAFDFAVTDVEFLSATEVLVTGSLAGRETVLGRFAGEVVYLVDLTTGTFTGSLYKVAANGDRLDQTVTGAFTATGSEGTFALVGGTGRFVHAAGGGTYVNAWTDPARTTGRVTFAGTITYSPSDRRP